MRSAEYYSKKAAKNGLKLVKLEYNNILEAIEDASSNRRRKVTMLIRYTENYVELQRLGFALNDQGYNRFIISW